MERGNQHEKKNPGKKILIAIGGLLAVTIVTLGIMTAVNFSKLHKAEQKMKDSGYYNPVSVGDHSLNVTKTGNPDGEHKIVALSGWGDGTYALSWEYMTEPLEKDNEFIFIDRAGYGMSDDWDGEATVEIGYETANYENIPFRVILHESIRASESGKMNEAATVYGYEPVTRYLYLYINGEPYDKPQSITFAK